MSETRTHGANYNGNDVIRRDRDTLSLLGTLVDTRLQVSSLNNAISRRLVLIPETTSSKSSATLETCSAY
ncbi:hypothetical protein DPMN_040954 [Dreissena polymorpha]|uniref:Uncharacterized protein n=1 Tax=Dreissena polymorpha TaxID=45954 RepID=A0A9D4HTI9_DREPO|nr:hypothetical protein DPMN_040954 [Dreissena polymorpha]